jgi:hypothetical protein
MEDKKYPCRTEETSGTTYVIKMYLDGSLRMSTSRVSKEEADRLVKNMSEKLPNFSFEISSHPWTNSVCIECGREEY